MNMNNQMTQIFHCVYGEGDPLSAEVIIENKLSGTQEDITENRKIVEQTGSLTYSRTFLCRSGRHKTLVK